MDAGLELTAKEDTLLTEVWRIKYAKPTEEFRIDSDGLVHHTRSVEVDAIFDAMHMYGHVVDKHMRKVKDKNLIGSLDNLTAVNWAKEWGCKVGSKEFAELASSRIKNDIDYRKFRVNS